jgi:PIN domain nuclease of toxin-antitoxin system
MNLLLDTHIWIWNDLQPEKLSSEVSQEMANANNELWLSPVSIWELMLLVEMKRLKLNQEFNRWVSDSVKDLDLKEVPFTWDVAHELRCSILQHGDPADRFLVATARAYDMTLITADQNLLRLPDLKLLPNV